MNVIRILPRFLRAHRALETFEQRERWSRTEIETFQIERVNRVWQHAKTHVRHYRQLCDEILMPDRFTSIAEFQATVPILQKGLVRYQNSEFLSDVKQQGYWKHTSGSTGSPTPIYWGKEAHLEMLQAKYRCYGQWGIGIFDPTVFLWGHYGSLTPGMKGYVSRIRQPWEDLLRNRMRLSAYDLGRPALQKHLRRIAGFRPATIYGYSTSVYHLALEAEATGFRCDSLKAITLTAEPAYPLIVAAVEKGFGVPAVVEYGSVETGIIAFEARDRTLRCREDVMLVETCPRDDGLFDIVVTVLNNPAFPLLRYAIGDITDKPLVTPPEGFSMMSRVAGRNNDCILTRSGKPIHPVWFLHLLDNRCQTTRRWQLRQHQDGRVNVLLERKRADVVVETGDLVRVISEHLEGYPVMIDVVDRLPAQTTGKHRWIVSDLANPSGRA